MMITRRWGMGGVAPNEDGRRPTHVEIEISLERGEFRTYLEKEERKGEESTEIYIQLELREQK